ncbi:VIT1/CCC1 transporter family protein [Lactiplantibacillus plantarum]|uniref:VIT1/CCC1 transporter family protein n=1 Tax=Lactiplantibacillus plantarum TaxID=1590 RepID=UPI0001AFFD36|nr:VIT family protein [Lactiplantibacillus plantarum]ACT63580.1 integral membrane protein [Lactiplantibacillus plantarum JDM1]AHN70416.1 Integral membrane protein [Lactiplantibacillus plantarum DOMLa]MCD7707265.1 VIT family protein [Lactiplantibacillus plantarum]QPB55292.1 VIT family protein [Lactiplantibacillus plantarum]WPG48420.1 VIT family protein [Lactiplantibacillus plantarum]
MKKRMSLVQRVNILRASVMGANDGILSVAGIVVGVAGATTNSFSILISGLAGMLAGTISMAMGEYVSVNTQKDSQKMAITKQKAALADDYEAEASLVVQKYVNQGISKPLAQQATREMMAEDALTTTVRERYGFNPNQFISPYAAGIASMIAFPTGSILPLVSITFFPPRVKVLATVLAVGIALMITGYVAAMLGNANRRRGMVRNVVAGLLTMIVTYFIGHLFA